MNKTIWNYIQYIRILKTSKEEKVWASIHAVLVFYHIKMLKHKTAEINAKIF